MPAEFSEVMHLVADFDAAVDHYTTALGFALESRQDWGFAIVTRDGARVGLCRVECFEPGWKPGQPLPRPMVAFKTSDIDGEWARLRAAGADPSPISSGDVRSFTASDKDGNRFFFWCDMSGAVGEA